MNLKKIIFLAILFITSITSCEFYVYADASIVEDQILTYGNLLAEKYSQVFGVKINPEDLMIKIDVCMNHEQFEFLLPFKFLKNQDGTFKKENDEIKFNLSQNNSKTVYNLTLKKSGNKSVLQLLKLLEKEANRIKSKL